MRRARALGRRGDLKNPEKREALWRRV